ncbi:MAG: PHP domain-containing protein, partial [Chlamydiia bacterium]|nr:PHP domain-containing protein [Chlamydiia bacterium]
MTETAAWIPLQVHSQYSILDASASPKSIARTASKWGIPAVALTDNGNMFGVVEFYKACKGEGIKPILGCEMYLAPESRHDKKRIPGKRNGYRLVLLAKNDTGYHNLCKLSSLGYLEGFYYNPRIDWELLTQHAEGLLCITGYVGTRLGDALLEEAPEAARALLDEHRQLFGDDLYLAVQNHAMTEEELHVHGMHEESWLLQRYQD